MRFGPLAAGALTPGARGRVVSVHRRAVNLRLEDGPLVALLPEGTPLHPWALSAPADCLRLTSGDAVRVAGGALDVGPLRIALEGAERVELRLRARPSAWPASAALAISECLARRPLDGPFDEPLCAALACFSAGGKAGDLAGLVGLGEGLTPSGDDALVGVLAGLDALEEAATDARAERAALAEALESVVTERTTTLSAQMLTAAAQGLYAEPVMGIAHALALDTSTAEETMTAILGMGHRSGADTLRGLAAALAWARRRPGYL